MAHRKHKIIAILCAFMLSGFGSANALNRTPLTGSDLVLVGAFSMPLSTGTHDTIYGAGLALRRVNGQVRLFSTARVQDNDYRLYEVTPPAQLSQSAPWTSASVVRNWGDVLRPHVAERVGGLFWDAMASRLYYSTSPIYVASGDAYKPTLAFASLDDNTGTATQYGKWGFQARSFKQTNFGVINIPTDFSTAYLGGKRLASGFGGYQSIENFGPISHGPALTAFDPPQVGTEGSYLPNIPLVGYGGATAAWTSGERPTKDRCWRADDFLYSLYGGMYGDSDGSTQQAISASWKLTGDESFTWQGYSVNANSRNYLPDNATTTVLTKHWVPGEAFWGADYIHQSAAWIQTQNKEGIVFVGDFLTGNVWYWGSFFRAEGTNHKWLIYTPEQLATVAQGSTTEDQIQPTRYDLEFPGIPYPGWTENSIPRYHVSGVAYDDVDMRLYVSVQHASNAPTVNSSSKHVVYVFQVNDTPPPAPTCSDGIQNQSETGIDCGGPCPACPCTPTNGGVEICGDSIDQDCSGGDLPCAPSANGRAKLGQIGSPGVRPVQLSAPGPGVGVMRLQ